MWGKRIALLLAIILLFTAQSCRGSSQTSQAKIGQVSVTTDTNLDNSPIMEMSTIINVSPQIYIAVEIINGRRGDNVQVVWEYQPTGNIIATEYFSGRYNATRPHEFKGGTVASTSWLSSVITLDDFSWPLGDYLVTIVLNRDLERTISFEMISKSGYDLKSKQEMIKSITFGKDINSRNQVILPVEDFARTDENIYASVLFADVPTSTQIKVNWKLLDTGRVISEFVQNFDGNGYLAFNLNLNQSSHTVWLRGNYVFQLYVDNILVITKHFIIF